AAAAPAAPAAAAPAAAPAAPIPAGLAPRRAQRLQYSAPSVDGGTHVETSQGPGPSDDFARVGRNDPCPCGSGRKFKRCHGDPRMRPDA
ncbi:MAG TPA: SEC-C metal-binding domain-containing protein, partial [Streptosporangiaceae bacterium]|nr:SEC-C metal-binding domain-containing protein [Streptosporangiaceae bacterium]